MYEAQNKREQANRAIQERFAYITGLLANTNLDDGKQTKRRVLESVDEDYQNKLRNIYNVIIEEIDDIEDNPFFKAMRIPGKDYIPGEEATENQPHDQNLEIDIDQGG